MDNKINALICICILKLLVKVTLKKNIPPWKHVSCGDTFFLPCFQRATLSVFGSLILIDAGRGSVEILRAQLEASNMALRQKSVAAKQRRAGSKHDQPAGPLAYYARPSGRPTVAPGSVSTNSLFVSLLAACLCSCLRACLMMPTCHVRMLAA